MAGEVSGFKATDTDSYDYMECALIKRANGVLSDFRYSLGLSIYIENINLLSEWRIPHTYLYSTELLPKPSDWEH